MQNFHSFKHFHGIAYPSILWHIGMYGRIRIRFFVFMFIFVFVFLLVLISMSIQNVPVHRHPSSNKLTFMTVPFFFPSFFLSVAQYACHKFIWLLLPSILLTANSSTKNMRHHKNQVIWQLCLRLACSKTAPITSALTIKPNYTLAGTTEVDEEWVDMRYSH